MSRIERTRPNELINSRIKVDSEEEEEKEGRSSVNRQIFVLPSRRMERGREITDCSFQKGSRGLECWRGTLQEQRNCYEDTVRVRGFSPMR